MNRTLVLLVAGSSALALAGCGPDFFLKPPKHSKSVFAVRTISKLTCPDEKGDLKLVSAAADGKSCAYKDGDTEVTLKLVSLNGGDAATALSPIEVELKSLMPAEDPLPATHDEHGKGDQANIDLPGVHIRADDHGARIKAPGVDINATDEDGSNTSSHRVTVTGDGEGRGARVEIDADEDGGNVSTDRRTRHTRHFGRMDGILAKFVMTAHTPLESSGYRIVGYEAHGPKDGPMAVAVVKSKKADVDEEDVFSDAKALVRLNVGPGNSHIIID